MRSTRASRGRLGGLRSRGRDRAVSFAETIAEDVPEIVDDLRRAAAPLAGTIAEEVPGIVDDLRREAAPIVERAMRGRRKSHKQRNFALLFLALGVIAAVAYWLRERGDERPAYLEGEHDRPNVTPSAGTPPPASPAPGPWGSEGSGDHEPMRGDNPERARADLEFAGASTGRDGDGV